MVQTWFQGSRQTWVQFRVRARVRIRHLVFLVWVTSKRLENLFSLKVLTKIEVPRHLSALLVPTCEGLHPSIYQNGKDIFREYKLLFYQKCVFCFFFCRVQKGWDLGLFGGAANIRLTAVQRCEACCPGCVSVLQQPEHTEVKRSGAQTAPPTIISTIYLRLHKDRRA